MPLFLFLLKRDLSEDEASHSSNFDTTHGFVVAEMNEGEARLCATSYRQIARDHRIRDEKPEVWLSPSTSCIKIGIAQSNVTRGVILEDHQWG